MAALALASLVAVPGTVAGAVNDYVALSPSQRLVDTRPGAVTVDGEQAGIGLRAAGSTLEVSVAGRGGVPVDADTVVLTVTAVQPAGIGFLTVHPTGTARPNAANVNYYASHNTANTVLSKVGTGGTVSIYTFAATHLVVDVSGHLPATSYTPLPAPRRLADGRPLAATFDGLHAGTGVVAGGNTLQLSVAGRAGVPADASTAVLNVTAVQPTGIGFSTVHPTGSARPNTSNVNYYESHNTANLVVARIGAGGDVCVHTFATSYYVIDVAGYLTGPPPPAAGPTCPPGPLPTWGPPTERTGDSITWARSFAASALGVVAATPSATDGPPASTTVAFSAVGEHWDDVADIDGVRFWDVVDGGPGFVAVGHEDTDDIGYYTPAGEFPLPAPAAWTSADGAVWTAAAISPAPFEYGLVDDVARTASGGFVASGTVWNGDGPSDQTRPVVWTSTDGLTWTIRTGPFGTFDGFVDTYVAAGAGGIVFIVTPFQFEGMEGPISAWWSTDGASWTAAPPIPSFGLAKGYPQDVAALGSGFVMVGQDQTDHVIPQVWTSPDGRTWNDPVPLPVRPETDQVIVQRMSSDGTALVMLGYDFDDSPDADPAATTKMWMSSDGANWVRVPAAALGVPVSFESVRVQEALPSDGGWIALGSGLVGRSDVGLVWRST